MKLLIIGGSGLIGSHLLPAARSAGHPALGTFRQFASPGLLAFDAADPAAAAALVETHSPHAVLYAAGWTWVDG